MALSSGTKLGPYEIQSPLGAGGMGEVYRAKDTRLGREVAIKVLPESLAKDADRLRRFEQEARAVAGLNHPNIFGIHVAGAGAGRTERCASGHFQFRCSVVRDAHRQTRLQTPDVRRNDDRDFARRATGAERHRLARSAGTATDSCAVPGKECRAAIPV